MPDGRLTLFLVIGFSLISASAVMDVIVRLRLRDAGEKGVFARGGTLNYRRYLRLRKEFGWPAWPVYWIFPLVLVGIAFVIWALFRN
jgi:hypothetical protein